MMLSTLDFSPQSLTSSPENPLILCYYTNISSQMQILRLSYSATQYLDQHDNSLDEDSTIDPEISQLDITTQGLGQRVIFPGQRILFQALPEAILKIYLGKAGRETFIDQIQCHHLRVYQGKDY
jgi:hypothetical protein